MRIASKVASCLGAFLAAALLALGAPPVHAVATGNMDYVAEAAIRGLADGWDVASIAPLFPERERAGLIADPIRASVKSLQTLGPVQGVVEHFRTFSTMSQFSMGAGQSTIATGTRAYLVQYAGGTAKVTVALRGDGSNTDVILLHIRKVMPQPTATVSLGRADGSVWSQFDSW